MAVHPAKQSPPASVPAPLRARAGDGPLASCRFEPLAAVDERIQKPGAAPSADGFRFNFSRVALGGTSIQRKTHVGASNDVFEREADAIADRVLHMAEPPRLAAAAPSLQRKCVACEEEDQRIQTKSESWAQAPTALDADAAVRATERSGQSLSGGLRAYFEPRFGVDFQHVRIHTDGEAARAAHGLSARAYTLGRDVVFGGGQYAPATEEGRRLIAHELAHVVQQGGAESAAPHMLAASPRIQRQDDTEDFRVTGTQGAPARRTAGRADRFFFELDRADFDTSVPEQAQEEQRLQNWASAHAGQHVSLVGRASQEGAVAHNRELAEARIQTVRAAVSAAGVIVDRVRVDMSFSNNPVDYRFYRSVEVNVAGSGDVDCDAFTQAQQDADVASCESALSAAHGRAVSIANAAMSRLRPSTDPEVAPAPARDAVLATRFPGLSRAALLPAFESIVTRLGQVGPGGLHTCHHRCFDCERPGSAGAGGPLDLCAPFYIPGFRGRGLPVDERVFLVLHETTHSAVAPGTGTASTAAGSVGVDVAYSRTRLFGVLNGSEAQHNTDSYVVTLLTLARGTGAAPAVLTSVGSAPVDAGHLATPAGGADRNRVAQRALGFAEAWLNYASFWTPLVYDFVAASLSAWDARGRGRLGHTLLELYAPLFELQHPGEVGLDTGDIAFVSAFQSEIQGRGFSLAAPSAHATQQDRTRVAGVYDRLTELMNALRVPLVIDRALSGDGSWIASGTAAGATLLLADAFFALAAADQARHALRLAARARPNISTGWVEAYVEAAQVIGRYRQLGP